MRRSPRSPRSTRCSRSSSSDGNARAHGPFGRAADIVAAARRILDDEGADALTMRRLAAEVGIQAPSLYKHFPTKRAVEAALIAEVLLEVGEILHAAVATPGRGPVPCGVSSRRTAGPAPANPAMYRLATSGRLPRADLPRASRIGRVDRSFSRPATPGRRRRCFPSRTAW